MDLQCDSHIYGQKSFCEKENHIADHLFDKKYACMYLPTNILIDIHAIQSVLNYRDNYISSLILIEIPIIEVYYTIDGKFYKSCPMTAKSNFFDTDSSR